MPLIPQILINSSNNPTHSYPANGSKNTWDGAIRTAVVESQRPHSRDGRIVRKTETNL